MKKIQISLSSIQDVREFVDTVSKFNTEIDLSSGRYVVDAKSIMGIFSLDLMHPITLSAHTDDVAEEQEIVAALQKFILK